MQQNLDMAGTSERIPSSVRETEEQRENSDQNNSVLMEVVPSDHLIEFLEQDREGSTAHEESEETISDLPSRAHINLIDSHSYSSTTDNLEAFHQASLGATNSYLTSRVMHRIDSELSLVPNSQLLHLAPHSYFNDFWRIFDSSYIPVDVRRRVIRQAGMDLFSVVPRGSFVASNTYLHIDASRTRMGSKNSDTSNPIIEAAKLKDVVALQREIRHVWDNKGRTVLKFLSAYERRQPWSQNKRQEYVNSLNNIVNVRDNDGNTPLFFVSQNGDIDSGKYLIDFDADVNGENKYGDTPLIKSLNSDSHNLYSFQYVLAN